MGRQPTKGRCRKERNGAGDRIRTGDIDLGKVALYQLSYSRSERKILFSFKNIRCVKRCRQEDESVVFIFLLETSSAVIEYSLVGTPVW